MLQICFTFVVYYVWGHYYIGEHYILPTGDLILSNIIYNTVLTINNSYSLYRLDLTAWRKLCLKPV